MNSIIGAVFNLIHSFLTTDIFVVFGYLSSRSFDDFLYHYLLLFWNLFIDGIETSCCLTCVPLHRASWLHGEQAIYALWRDITVYDVKPVLGKRAGQVSRLLVNHDWRKRHCVFKAIHYYRFINRFLFKINRRV